jgi:small subunit ribosomal protein S3
MEAGALGAEIVISGKLRTERARFEKFRAGYLVKCGDPSLKYMQKAEVHVQLKPGIFGVRVRIMPPDAIFPDKLKIVESLPPEVKPEEKAAETEAEQQVEQDVEQETPVEEAEAEDAMTEENGSEETEEGETAQ